MTGEGFPIGLGVDPGGHVVVKVLNVRAAGDELVHAVAEGLEDLFQAPVHPLHALEPGGVANEVQCPICLVSEVEEVLGVAENRGGHGEEDPGAFQKIVFERIQVDAGAGDEDAHPLHKLVVFRCPCLKPSLDSLFR